MVVHPELELIDEIVRMLGWPSLLAGFAWGVRKWDKGQHEFKEMAENTKMAVQGVKLVRDQVTVLETNHMAHLQAGITQLVASNDKAVDVLQTIDKGIAVLVDRANRA